MKARGILILLAGFLVLDVLVLGGYWFLSRRAPSASPQAAPVSPQAASPEGLAAAKAHVAEGFAFRRNRQLAEAVASFEAAIREQPDYSDSYHGLAQVQREMGDPGAALANHDRAIELDPKRHDLYWERGVTRQQIKNFDAAIADYEACLQRNSRFASAHLGLGECYRAKGDFQKALSHLDEAIQLEPNSDWFYRERGNTHQQMGNRDLAEADFAKMRELQQNRK